MEIRLITYDENFLSKSLIWLNDPEIRTLTDTQSVVTPELQKQWFCKILEDSTYQIWGVMCDNVPIGACGIKHIDYVKREGEYWGYIGEKQYWGGKGHDLMQALFSKARELLIDKLNLYVLKTNQRAVHLYLNEGFEISHEDELRIYMSKKL